MPTIKYPKNPNVETAFVEQYDGTKNRVVMTAPQDISTLEYPSNPNSTKGYVTVNGKKQRVIMVADIAGGGGGSAVTSVNGKTGDVVLNAKDVSAIPQVASMPTVTEETIVQYVGTTNASYTNGYFYKATGTTTYTGTVSFDPASISGTTATCSGDDFAELVAEYGTGNITDIIKGTLTYDLAGGLLVFVGLDDTDTQVCTFQLYTQDYTDAGFVFTGTLADGDVIAFTTTISESTTYSWARIDVQPAPEALPDQTGNNGKFLSTNGTTASWETVGGLPSQTGQSGKFLTTDGTDASWSDKPLVNTATGPYSVTVGSAWGAASTKATSVGNGSDASGDFSTAAGFESYVASGKSHGLCVGAQSYVGAIGAMQFGKGSNSEAGTVYYGLTTDGTTFTNYKLLDSDGTIPKARLANVATVPATTPSLVVADWSSNTQTITVTGVTASNVVLVSPAPSSASDYASAGIICTAQGTDSLTFTCDTVPTNAIDLSVVIL